MGRSKRYREISKNIDKDKPYPLEEALKIVKSEFIDESRAKRGETVELSINLGIDSQRSDQQVRGSVSLPKGTGKKMTVVAIVEGQSGEQAKKEGADFVGTDELIQKIEKGWTEFDKVVTTPEMMKKIAKLGKILGPRGLMPSPKSGTVTDNLASAIKEIKAGRAEFRTDKGGNLHLVVGKSIFSEDDLKNNILACIKEIVRTKPPKTKGVYLKKAYLSLCMSPSLRLDPKELLELVRG